MRAIVRLVVRSLTAAAALAVLTACGSGSSGSAPTVPQPPNPGAVLTRIVGVGDSLTAGEQADGLLGITYVNPVSGFPGNIVPATQENGFWSLLFQQATGTPLASMYDPSKSPLPLIGSPGLLSQLVPMAPLFGPSHAPCDQFNDAAYALNTFATTRLNPASQPLDLGIPGITAHEALFMINPLTGPSQLPNCQYPFNPKDPTTALQPVVDAESGTFYSVLGGFAATVRPLTQVNVAISLHPSLTTVWLGANDLLKYAFSGGQAPSDSPAQMRADVTSIIRQLHAAGSRVVVGNLPDVLALPQFFPGGPVLTGTLQAFGVPANAAQAITAYIQATYGVGAGGFLTESGFFSVLLQAQGGSITPVLNPPGDFLTDAFAAQVQALNTAYNTAIAAAAAANKAPLVDIHAKFVALEAGDPINPPKCCSLAFGGGLLSFDGLHPSNTGYAEIANVFIAQINASYGTAIPAVNVVNVYLTDPYAPH